MRVSGNFPAAREWNLGRPCLRRLCASLRELNLQVEAAHALFSRVHAYPDRQVELHFWRVTDYRGEAQGVEGKTSDGFTRMILPR